MGHLQVVCGDFQCLATVELKESLNLHMKVLLLLLEAAHSLVKKTTGSTSRKVAQPIYLLIERDRDSVELDLF